MSIERPTLKIKGHLSHSPWTVDVAPDTVRISHAQSKYFEVTASAKSKGPIVTELTKKGNPPRGGAPVGIICLTLNPNGYILTEKEIPVRSDQKQEPKISRRIRRAGTGNPNYPGLTQKNGKLPTRLVTLPGVVRGPIDVSVKLAPDSEGDGFVPPEEMLPTLARDGLGLAALGLASLTNLKIAKNVFGMSLPDAITHGLKSLQTTNTIPTSTLDGFPKWRNVVGKRRLKELTITVESQSGEQPVVKELKAKTEGGITIANGKGAIITNNGIIEYPMPVLEFPENSARTLVLREGKNGPEILVKKRKRGGARIVDASEFPLNSLNGTLVRIGEIFPNSQRIAGSVKLCVLVAHKDFDPKNGYEWVPISALRGRNRPGRRVPEYEVTTDGEAIAFAALALIGLHGISQE